MTLTADLGHVSASYVNLLFDWLEATHPDLASQIPHSRPTPGELNRVRVVEWQKMLAWVDAKLQDPEMPLNVASHVRPANTGLLGYVASCCATLGEAFARLQQFENLIYSVNALQVVFENGLLCLRWGAERGKPGHLVDSLAIGVLVAFTRTLLLRNPPLVRVKFVNPEPLNTRCFEGFFQCPVIFDCDYTELAFPDEILTWPLKTPDAVLRQVLDQQAQGLLKQVQAGTEPIPGFRRALQDSITAGQPSLDATANRLCVSTRTLQRRLAVQGMSFRTELERVRIEIAQNCLASRELSLADIANFLGYNDQSAFTHAFKRALGVSPAKYQKTCR